MADWTGDMQLWMTLLTLMSSTGDVKIPKEFHKRCFEVSQMLESDTTGLISTIVDYAVDSASSVDFKIKANNATLEKELNKWLNDLNSDYRNNMPTGLRELAKDYFKERWEGSSLIVLKIHWTEKNGILLPDAIWLMDGSAIYIEDGEKAETVKLGNFKYFLGKPDKKNLLSDDSNYTILVRKPFERWFVKYPTPYLVKKGVLRNFKGIEVLKDKGDEVIKKVLPYIAFLTKGTERLAVEGKVSYDDKDMKAIQSNFKDFLKSYKEKKDELPLYTAPFDTNFQHLIPDIKGIVSKELFEQGTRAILSGLGFVDVVSSVTSSRKESVLNPEPFIEEVNCGLKDFRDLLLDVSKLIIEKNVEAHRKYFSENNEIKIVNSPMKLNVLQLLDSLRLGYIYGVSSIETYQEMLGLDHETEKQRRKKEAEDGMDDLFFPHVIQNIEGVSDLPVAPSKKKEEKQTEKTEFNAKNEEEKITAPYTNISELPKGVKDNMDEGLQKTFLDVFNKALKTYKNEERAFKVAWSVIKKIAEKGDDGIWHRIKGEEIEAFIGKVYNYLDSLNEPVKKEDLDTIVKIKKLEILDKQNKLISRMLNEGGESNENI